MRERDKGATIEVASLKAGMTRRTGSKYLKTGKLPSDQKTTRDWRTRPDPFEADWPVVEVMLEDAPELEAKSLFEWLLESTGRYEPGQVRTFQRRVRQWRALHGPGKEVFFPQQHQPGESAQTDFTWATELGVTIAGVPFNHKLCHLVLPYSNWAWATVCRSESLPALRHGVQEALFRLGKRPMWHQTDNSTAATHDVPSGKRAFNDNYVRLMDHLGMKPRTIGIGKSNQNGDVEAMNGALKRRLKQHLLLRGSSDFESVAAYEVWLAGVLTKANALRTKRLEEELAVMEPLTVARLPAYSEERIKVTSWSTIRVKFNTYSVPSRLIGEKVKVRIYDDRLEVYFADVRQLVTDRLQGRKRHHIDYRHIIWWLVRKPGAFPRYRYREDLFPSLEFRRAYDALCEHRSPRKADIAYLRILHLAASTMEAHVQAGLELLLQDGQIPDFEVVKELVQPETPEVPSLKAFVPQLSDYNVLLEATA